MKVRRDRKYSYLASALNAVSKEQVVKSWGAPGLLRAVWNDVPPSTLTIYYDQYRRLAELDIEETEPMGPDNEADEEK
ncbi:hypothetical protein DIPPA_19240 [Diplonema papillatum]|nr:hypothetical protein DIPPA_19240 [Diplonema papillatum]